MGLLTMHQAQVHCHCVCSSSPDFLKAARVTANDVFLLTELSVFGRDTLMEAPLLGGIQLCEGSDLTCKGP